MYIEPPSHSYIITTVVINIHNIKGRTKLSYQLLALWLQFLAVKVFSEGVFQHSTVDDAIPSYHLLR